MKKKVALFLGTVILGVLMWYFFLKPHDYVVRFDSKALPGTINQTLKFWEKRLDKAELLQQSDLSNLQFHIPFNDSIHTYHWKLESLNDSVTKVKAYVIDNDHSFINRLTIPFSETDFEKRTKKTVREFAKVLEEHLQSFKVRVTGETVTTSKYCACFPLKGTQLQKAGGMMEYYGLLSGLMVENKVELDGRPLVEITDWNMETDSISYNFCFPVIKTDSLPQRSGLIYRELKKRSAIRAVYNGNYITSDRAWYALIDYARKNNIPIEKKPLEIFHTNPNLGGNELEWEAEVFMPIQE